MTSDNVSLAYLVALETREWAEKYHKQSPDKYWPGLGGMCAIASARLFKDLKKLKLNPQIHLGSNHCFVVVDDHVIDVTATQFSRWQFPNVYVEKLQDAQSLCFYFRDAQVFNCLDALNEHMAKEDWPKHQRPLTA